MIQKSLIDKIIRTSQKIQKSSLRGSSNYITISDESADMIQDAYRKHISNCRKDKIRRLLDL